MSSLIVTYLPRTLLLMGLANVLALLVAVPMGLFQGAKRNTIGDYVLTGVAFVFYSMPAFWLGLLLIDLFAIRLHVFPPEAPQGPFAQILSNPAGLVLPVASLALVSIALFARYMRSSTIENMALDYVRTARARGASQRRILFRHVLRNALVPVITLVGLSLPYIFSGALITESVFNYPGMGLLFWNAAQSKDFPVLIGVVLVVGIATVVGSLLADMLYAALDPRVRYVR